MFEYNMQRLTPEEFEKFSKLVYDESGIFMKDSKITLLSNRLRKRLQALDINSFSEYFDYIQKLSDKTHELDLLLDVVSTNETYFFRSERHFAALMQKCVPDIIAKKKDRKLTVWSAGCSTGEEPYTIAICLSELKDILFGWDVEILATDIAFSVLDFARQGKYSGRRIDKVPPNLLEKYFDKSENEEDVFIVKKQLKDMVKFGTLNLFKDKFPRNIDLIFCRNVMIYFDREHQRTLVKNFYDALSKTNGYFFIGHSETLHSVSEDFAYMKIMDSPVYVPKERLNEFSSN